MAAAVAEGGGAAGGAFAAATLEALEDLGFEGDGDGDGAGAAAALLAAMHTEDPESASGALGALDPALAAAAVAGLPGDAAARASGVKDPTTVAAMLEEMPADKRAAMLIKMDAEASAAAASAMDPGLAGEAMEAAQRAALLGGADADAFGDALGDAAVRFGAGGADAARLRDSDLGAGSGHVSDAASDVSARLTAMLSKMDPSPPRRRRRPWTSASRRRRSAPAAECAAAMIASGGLDAADAAAMLDKLSVDAADRVMAALPPNVAERTAALVASDEIRARAAARAVVHLASSHVSGPNCETCVAGAGAALLLESANPGGGRLTRGGAHVVATVYALEPEYDANGDRTAPEGKGHARARPAFPRSWGPPPISARARTRSGTSSKKRAGTTWSSPPPARAASW